MNPDNFLNALGDFLSSMSGNLVVGLNTLWNHRVRRTTDPVMPRCLFPAVTAKKTSWFTEELRAMKGMAVSYSDAGGIRRVNQIRHLLGPTIGLTPIAKKSYFATIIVSV